MDAHLLLTACCAVTLAGCTSRELHVLGNAAEGARSLLIATEEGGGLEILAFAAPFDRFALATPTEASQVWFLFYDQPLEALAISPGKVSPAPEETCGLPRPRKILVARGPAWFEESAAFSPLLEAYSSFPGTCPCTELESSSSPLPLNPDGSPNHHEIRVLAKLGDREALVGTLQDDQESARVGMFYRAAVPDSVVEIQPVALSSRTPSAASFRDAQGTIWLAGVRGTGPTRVPALVRMTRDERGGFVLSPVDTSTLPRRVEIVGLDGLSEPGSEAGSPEELALALSDGSLWLMRGDRFDLRVPAVADTTGYILTSHGNRVLWLGPGDVLFARETPELLHARPDGSAVEIPLPNNSGRAIAASIGRSAGGHVVAVGVDEALKSGLFAVDPAHDTATLLGYSSVVQIGVVVPFEGGFIIAGRLGLIAQWILALQDRECPIQNVARGRIVRALRLDSGLLLGHASAGHDAISEVTWIPLRSR